MRDKNQIIVTATDPYSTKKNFGVLEDGRKWLVNDFMVKKEIIAAGLGWGGLPDYMIKDELKKKSLTTISNAKAAPLEFKTYALRRKDMTYGKVGSELWKSLEQNNFI